MDNSHYAAIIPQLPTDWYDSSGFSPRFYRSDPIFLPHLVLFYFNRLCVRRQISRKKGENPHLRDLYTHLKGHRLVSVLAPLFKMLEALFDLFVPLVVADIVNTGIRNQDTAYILNRCGLLVALALIGLTCSVVAQYFAARASVCCASSLRRALFAHIQALGFSEVDTIGGSTLITRMSSDINQVQNGLNMFLRLFLRSPFIVFGAAIMAFSLDRTVATVFLLAIPVLFVIVFGLMAITTPLYRKVQTRLDSVLGATRENLSGVRVVRAFARETEEQQRFTNFHTALTRLQLFVGRISALMNPLTYVVVNLAFIAILTLGARQVQGGWLLDGDVIALVNYMSQVLIELVKLANTVILISRALASMNRVSSVLHTPLSMTFPSATAPAQNSAAVVFDDVCLTYHGAGDESLSHISFTAQSGQTIGVIGSTGSGKSSLVHLIPRFYDATSGTVSVLGRPAAQWEKGELRKKVAVVLQKAQLFSGTIRSNLLWGDETATDAQLWNALEAAQGAAFVREKPLGLDEPVEQGGRNFSGGQRQRLTIARALVGKPDILILDDSASALDFATDAALRKSLRELSWHPTVFLVSQRTASLRKADKILVLDDGQLVGQGTHTELLDSCPVYREIYESQFEKGGDAQ